MVCSFIAKAQQTSMVIDNQTPGWLSSKINYGDQQTLQNLKVTGYLNSSDLKFIGQMVSKHSLRGCIDLEDANIVGETTSSDNIMPENSFNKTDYDSITISHIKFPLSITSSNKCLHDYLKVDTITIGGEMLPSVNSDFLYSSISVPSGAKFNRNIKNLIIREGVTEIPDYGFNNNTFYWHDQTDKEDCRFHSVSIPSTVKKIGKQAFCASFNLSIINLTDNIEEIGDCAFLSTAYKPDTLYLPKNLKIYHTRGFNLPKVLYFDEAIEDINNRYQTYNNSFNMYYDHDYIESYDTIEIHMKRQTPPNLRCYNASSCLKNCTVYVPKSAVSLYQNAERWKYALILPEPVPPTAIDINFESIEIVKGKTKQLSAVVFPTDADSQEYIWTSSNDEIASVSPTGLVTANTSGEVYIYATLTTDNSIIDSCKVKVYQPVTSVSLNVKEKVLNVGETYTLTASIAPYDADNKSIIWTSENPEIATVENGTITALKSGIVKITATSEENSNITDFCEVTVTQPVTGINLNYATYKLEGIGDMVQLEATITPEDATNKKINWKSSNENVCVVSNGKVVAVGYGTAVIIAITADGGHMATCTIVVEDATGINEINTTNEEVKIYDVQGRPSTLKTKGVKIIRFADGTSMKIVIK